MMIEEEYNEIGKRIDDAIDCGDTGALNKLITECSQLNLKEDSPTLLYFIANIFSALRNLSENEKSINTWEWNSDYRKKEFLNLRKAIQHNKFKDINAARRCQIHTNLGNLLSNTGRFIEAFDEWEKALRIFPKFSMALIQIPYCLFHVYSKLVSDDGHKYLFYQKIYDHYSMDLDKLEYPLELHAVDAVKEEKRKFCEWWSAIKDDAFRDLKMHHNKIEDYNISLGRSKEERLYRQWCLQNKLFINPLNDLGSYTFAARDIYSIGNTKCKIGHGPWFHYMFDQMKQEFIAARYMLFCAVNKFSKSYVDKDVLLTDTLDWPVYGLDIEQIKISYRITYSILDKIAYFLNKYFDLGNKEQYFRYTAPH